MDNDARAYPNLRFAQVVLAAAAAIVFVIAGWFLLRYLPARRALAEAERRHALYSVGQAYLEFERDNHGDTPRRRSDLEPYLAARNAKALQWLYNGKYVVIWRADLNDDVVISEHVLGYESSIAACDAYVLFADGHTDRVSPRDFASLPQVKSK